MAKKLKEDVNLDEIDENFIISSFKTTEPQQTGGTLQAVERAKENREAGKGKKRGLSEYGEKFLKRNELKTRQCVYISGQIHAVISRLVHVIRFSEPIIIITFCIKDNHYVLLCHLSTNLMN